MEKKISLSMSSENLVVWMAYLGSAIKALQESLTEHAEHKIHAESVISLNKLRLSTGNLEDPAQEAFKRLTGEDPVEAAQEFLDHYDKCVERQQSELLALRSIQEEIKSQLNK